MKPRFSFKYDGKEYAVDACGIELDGVKIAVDAMHWRVHSS